MYDTPASLPPYARAMRYASADAARAAYQHIQDFIYAHEEVELSVYNLVVAQVPHVVILGEQAGDMFNGQLTGMLASGEPTHLPPALIQRLATRRGEQEGSWSERHPGLPGEPLP